MFRFVFLPLALLATARAELIATFRQGGETDARLERMAALSVPAGQPPTPFLGAGSGKAPSS
jgi:hypothetical protein